MNPEINQIAFYRTEICAIVGKKIINSDQQNKISGKD